MKNKTIMIVEDDVGIRELTEIYLLNKGYNVVTTENGKDALKKLQSIKPHLILLDIEMPKMDGFTACQQIRKKVTCPIIFLTVRKDISDKIKCFELGGDDYVTKPFNFDELEARIKANIRRYFTYPQKKANILKYKELEINLTNFECHLNGEKINLSKKEMKLLILLAKHPNQVWSKEQLYEQIWSLDATGNVDTVKVHISYLRRKLDPQFIQTVRGFGYRFSG